VALREIRKYQKSTDLLIRKLPFARLVGGQGCGALQGVWLDWGPRPEGPRAAAAPPRCSTAAADSTGAAVAVALQVREIGNQVAPEPFRWTAESMLALQEVSGGSGSSSGQAQRALVPAAARAAGGAASAPGALPPPPHTHTHTHTNPTPRGASGVAMGRGPGPHPAIRRTY
jgi:hypothetical protein